MSTYTSHRLLTAALTIWALISIVGVGERIYSDVCRAGADRIEAAFKRWNP